VGYDTISDILNATLALKLLIVVMLAKAIALVVSLGSGTSGGLLAPMFMSSAAMGGVFALVVDRIFPGAHLSAGAFALVAMGAVFGAALCVLLSVFWLGSIDRGIPTKTVTPPG